MSALVGTTRVYPDGIASWEPVSYGQRRWNGSVWANTQVDTYNAELDRIRSRHDAGLSVTHLVNGLYNLAHGFDNVISRAEIA